MRCLLWLITIHEVLGPAYAKEERCPHQVNEPAYDFPHTLFRSISISEFINAPALAGQRSRELCV